MKLSQILSKEFLEKHSHFFVVTQSNVERCAADGSTVELYGLELGDAELDEEYTLYTDDGEEFSRETGREIMQILVEEL